MKVYLTIMIGLLSLPVEAQVSSFYCPTGHGYINPGMSSSQVLTACGQPTSIEKTNQPLIEQIPMTQLIYTNLNQGAPYTGLDVTYQMWSINSGTNEVSAQFNVVNGQIRSISVNGQNVNAMSVCGETPLQIGDSADSVYSACGSPSMVNQTYIKEPVRTSNNAKPETWIYNADQYSPSFRLTFLNGILQSISQ